MNKVPSIQPRKENIHKAVRGIYPVAQSPIGLRSQSNKVLPVGLTGTKLGTKPQLCTGLHSGVSDVKFMISAHLPLLGVAHREFTLQFINCVSQVLGVRQ